MHVQIAKVINLSNDPPAGVLKGGVPVAILTVEAVPMNGAHQWEDKEALGRHPCLRLIRCEIAVREAGVDGDGGNRNVELEGPVEVLRWIRNGT